MKELKDLTESEQVFRALAAAAFEGIAIHDQGVILEVNERLSEMFGYTRSELLGKSALDLTASESRELVLQKILTRSEDPYEADGLRKDGTKFTCELHGRSFPFQGRSVRVTAIRDITEKKQLELERKEALAALQQSEERYRAFVRQSSEGIWRIQLANPLSVDLPVEQQMDEIIKNFSVAESNEAFARMHGFVNTEELIGKPVRQFPVPIAQTRSVQRQFIASGYRLVDAQSQETDSAGNKRFFLNNTIGIVENGNLVGIWGTQRDITYLKQAEEAIRASEQRYRLLFERNLAGVFRSTLDGEILDCNESFARILGYGRSELLQETSWNLYPIRALRLEMVQRLREQKALTNHDVCLKKKDGTLLWGLANLSLMEDLNPPILEGTLFDITDRKKAEEQIAYQAYHDGLTGLPNRTLFHDRLAQVLSAAERAGLGLSVMFLDLDHFKLINDSMGHSVGDWLLRQIAERIKGCIRNVDTVARLGGDEFILLLPEVARSEDAARIAQKLLDVISAPLVYEYHDLYITTSVGISLYPGDGTDVETLIRSADNALYRAKELGRRNYQFWSPQLQDRAEKRLSLERSLRHAVDRQEFILYFQPQFKVQTGKASGVEALIRWQHPERGLVFPGDFIAAAEDTRLILPIGEWVLRTACKQVKEWHDLGFADLMLSVNLSAHQFQQPDLADLLSNTLKETGFPASSLVLEITETVAMKDVDHTMKLLHTIKQKGIRIALDDFGMGYSSLSYLKHFPIDIIKIDPSFVKDVGKGVQEEALVRAVIHLGHSLNRSIVAEGVETELQYFFLKRERCEEIQGNLLCAAVPPDQALKVLLAGTVRPE